MLFKLGVRRRWSVLLLLCLEFSAVWATVRVGNDAAVGRKFCFIYDMALAISIPYT